MPQSIASRIEGVTRYRQGAGALPGDPWDEAYTSDYEIAPGASAEDARAALRLTERLLAPANRRDCGKEVGMLKVMTKEKNLGADDLDLQVRVYAEELSRYPLDAVRAACRGWAASQTFFPAWAELKRACEAEVLLRRRLVAGLEAYIELAEQRAEAAAKALPAQETKACQVWRDHHMAIMAALGEQAWRTWLIDAIPHRDDGETLELAVPSAFYAKHIEESYGAKLGEILGRRVVVSVQHFAGQAKSARDAKAHATQSRKEDAA